MCVHVCIFNRVHLGSVPIVNDNNSGSNVTSVGSVPSDVTDNFPTEDAS